MCVYCRHAYVCTLAHLYTCVCVQELVCSKQTLNAFIDTVPQKVLQKYIELVAVKIFNSINKVYFIVQVN